MENKQIENDKVLYKPIITDIKELVHAGRNAAYNAVNKATIMTYWNIGKKIVEEEQAGTERAEYGKESAIEELLERMRAESKLDTFSFLVAS